MDATERPLTSEIRQIDAQALCTNRDLPVHMATGQGRTDFTWRFRVRTQKFEPQQFVFGAPAARPAETVPAADLAV